MLQVYISAGSNIDPEANIRSGIYQVVTLLHHPRIASLYRTDPVGLMDQPDFLNTVLSGWTDSTPEKLLDSLQEIEYGHGRDRSGPRWGPRTLDLDILLFGEVMLQTKRLRIPHPEMCRRRFVLEPLLELEPGMVDPESGRSFSSFLEELPSGGVYRVGPVE